jgi:hypothetical protein
MIDIICWKWKGALDYRTKYGPENVNILHSMIKRHTTLPFRFSCITDDPEGIDSDIRVIPLWDDFSSLLNPNVRNGPSCYRRLKVFSPEARKLIGKRILSIDLDCIILSNIDSILSRKEKFICMRGTARNTKYNGGLWLLKAGYGSQVYNTFDPEKSPQITKNLNIVGSDQAWISYVLPNEPVFTPDDGILSFRVDLCNGKNYDKSLWKKHSANVKIVLFNGKADPWNIDLKWIRENYR